MNEEKFIEELKKIGITITEFQLVQLNTYYKLLIEWNKKFNLTKIINKEDVYLKHFYDSLTLVKITNLNKEISLCDLGTGAGFPGIIIKMVFPNVNVTLVESLTKRTVFLKEIIQKLNLKKIEVINERAEIYSRNNIEKHDILTARAVSKLNILMEFSMPLLKVSGHFIAMKGTCEEEINNIDNSLKKLDATINNVMRFKLPIENSHRTLIDIVKTKKTSDVYPRKFDKIKKNPL